MSICMSRPKLYKATDPHFLFALLIVVIFILISFLILVIFGAVDLFLALLTQVAFSLGGRAISEK